MVPSEAPWEKSVPGLSPDSHGLLALPQLPWLQRQLCLHPFFLWHSQALTREGIIVIRPGIAFYSAWYRSGQIRLGMGPVYGLFGEDCGNLYRSGYLRKKAKGRGGGQIYPRILKASEVSLRSTHRKGTGSNKLSRKIFLWQVGGCIKTGGQLGESCSSLSKKQSWRRGGASWKTPVLWMQLRW